MARRLPQASIFGFSIYNKRNLAPEILHTSRKASAEPCLAFRSEWNILFSNSVSSPRLTSHGMRRFLRALVPRNKFLVAADLNVYRESESRLLVKCNSCNTTGMFALSNPMSHVSSAAFAQARLRLGSGLLRFAQVCSPPMTRRGAVKTNLTDTGDLRRYLHPCILKIAFTLASRTFLSIYSL